MKTQDLGPSDSKVAVNTFYLSLDVMLTSSLGLAFWVAAARVVPVRELGEATIAITIAILFAATAGTKVAASKFIGENYNKDDSAIVKHVMTVGAIITLLVGVGATATVLVLSPWLSKSVYNSASLMSLITLAAVAIPIICIWDFLSGVFIGMQKAIYQLVVNTVYSSSRVALILIFATLGFQALSPVLAFLLGYLIAVIVGVTLALGKIASRTSNSDLTERRGLSNRIIKFSLINYGSNTLTKLKLNLPILILGLYGTVHVALYNIPFLVATAVTMFASTVGVALLPAVSRETTRSLNGASRLINLVFATFLLLVGPTFSALIVFPESLLSLLSKEYIPAAPALRILSIGALFVAVGLVIQSILNAVGRAKSVFQIITAYTLTEISLAPLLIFSFGMTGAAVGFAVAGALNSGIGIYLAKRIGLDLDLRRLFTPLLCIGGSVAVGLLLLSIGHTTYVASLGMAVAYIAIARILGGFGSVEFSIISKTIKSALGAKAIS